MSEIVDAHVHLLPGRLGTAVRAFFVERITGDKLAYPADNQATLDILHAAGVGTVWSLPYAHKAGVAAGLNAASAATLAQYAGHPVAIIGGATAHPHDPDTGATIREAFETYDLRVVKLHCSVGNFLADDAGLDGLWAYVSKRRMPVIVHTGMAVTGHTTAPDLAPIERVARAYPDARIIIAHCGHPATQRALALVEMYPNVYADLVCVVFEPVDVPASRAQKLARKLLFGSDAPNTGRTIQQSLDFIESLGLTPDAHALVMGGNARRLLAEITG